MEYIYKTQGVCPKEMVFEIDENDRVQSLKILGGGCNGNLKGINALIRGMTCEEVVEKLLGIRCNNRDTSCPDQIAKALKEYKNNNGEILNG